ncbi:hypothetical protein NADFUDRAFT_20069 [Nadsonia fulvescens var. elongata DSM 6958]|uniref:GPI-anchored wall transfer protein n=1 Tax=Nadsonia fulvescens var. elongata DSM 6958 TaxID=857566 RepID=A0A1E3PTM1_9ASCO|nr:hypothetical protein NADFUDRAFT_20069 [Nadsonia fulvescens var. elongata DSM 6958]
MGDYESKASSAQSLKYLKEQFVSDLSGGKVSEIYLVTFVAISTYATWCALQSRFRFFSNRWSLPVILTDLSLNWLGVLFSVTTYSSEPGYLNSLLIFPALVLIFSPPIKNVSAESDPLTSDDGLVPYLLKKSYLTPYRGGMMVITCLAILAVDFRVFPRRFAKVETWGTSLMDLGVGSFVFSMGLVSARGVLVDAFKDTKRPFVSTLVASFKSASSILSLGAIRLILVKLLNYQEHVSEYGVHWNFFMTLGFLPPFVSTFNYFSRRIPTFFLALLVGVVYECLLDGTSLGGFILTAERTNLITQNKEGLFSFFGYFAIFLSGQATGYFVLPSKIINLKAIMIPQNSRAISSYSGKISGRVQTLKALMLCSAFYHLLFLYLDKFLYLTPSRRLANLPYITWVVSYNTLFLGLYVLVEILFFPVSCNISYDEAVPYSFEAINTNGLPIFLLSNILTGLVNMVFNTIEASVMKSMLILVGYATMLFAVSIVLRRAGIRIKI